MTWRRAGPRGAGLPARPRTKNEDTLPARLAHAAAPTRRSRRRARPSSAVRATQTTLEGARRRRLSTPAAAGVGCVVERERGREGEKEKERVACVQRERGRERERERERERKKEREKEKKSCMCSESERPSCTQQKWLQGRVARRTWRFEAGCGTARWSGEDGCPEGLLSARDVSD